MSASEMEELRAPRYRIERAVRGYRVVGEELQVWEPTLREASNCRDELEWPGWRHALLPAIAGRGARPLGELVYGPVMSRRLGRSLGVNLTPLGGRVCSFRCVYCYVPKRAPRGGWPTPTGIADSLASALPLVGPLDSITISGDGEPTLHPRFGAAVAVILGEARRLRPDVPVRILTNGTSAIWPEVRRALDLLDERVVTLDAAPERVDRPDAHCPLGAVIHALSLLKDVTIQACFIDGVVSNIDDEAVREWVDLVGEIRPRAVQLYTINCRPSRCDVRPVSTQQLEEIACILRDRRGVEAQVFA